MNSMQLAKNIYSKQVTMVSARNGYGAGVVKAGKSNKDIVVLCADLTESTRSLAFKQAFPGRFIEVGVAEQNMAGIAAGLALSGKIPFISSYAVFSPGRNWDQIRISICYSGANVKVIGAHAGISVGPDGATHQALEDIAITRVLPRMTVICPADALETEKAIIASSKIQGPIYIRFGRDPVPVITTKKTPFKVGKAEIYKEGTDVSIVACGALVYEALIAAKKLVKKSIHAQVINNHTIKPLDSRTLIQSAKKTGAVVTAEEHQIHGGMGSAVMELLAEHEPVPIERVGIKDTFGESGKPSELMKVYGLTSDDIIKAVLKVIKRKS